MYAGSTRRSDVNAYQRYNAQRNCQCKPPSGTATGTKVPIPNRDTQPDLN